MFSIIPFILLFPIYFKVSYSIIYPFIIPFLFSKSSDLLSSKKSNGVKRSKLSTDLHRLGFSFEESILEKNSNVNDPYSVSNSSKSNISPSSKEELLHPKINPIEHIDILHFISKVTFSSTVSLAFLIIQLVFSEIAEWISPESRKVVWNFTLPFLVLDLTYIVPCLCIINLLRAKLSSFIFKWYESKRGQLVMILVVFVSWSIFFNSAGEFLYSRYHLGSSPESSETDLKAAGKHFLFKLILTSLQEVTVLGITLLSFLSGIGSVSCLFYTYLKKDKQVNKEQINRLLQTLRTTDSLLKMRESEYNQAASNDLRDEIKAINQMKNSIIDDIQYLVKKLLVQKFNNTFSGKMSNVFNVGFSVYCVYKIFSTFVLKLPVIFFHEHYNSNNTESSTSDALAITIANVICQFNPQYEVSELSVLVSLILSMSLFICSFSSVLTTLKSFLRIVPYFHEHHHHHHHLNSAGSATSTTTTYQLNYTPISKVRQFNNFVVLLCAELTGIYVLSTTLLLLSMLPQELNSHIVESFGNPVDNKFVTIWFDKMYGLSCTITLIWLFISDKIEKFYNDDDDEDDFVFDEESLVESKVA